MPYVDCTMGSAMCDRDCSTASEREAARCAHLAAQSKALTGARNQVHALVALACLAAVLRKRAAHR